MTRIQEANRIWCGKTAKPKPIQTAKTKGRLKPNILKMIKRRKQRQHAIPSFAWNESCCLNNKKVVWKRNMVFRRPCRFDDCYLAAWAAAVVFRPGETRFVIFDGRMSSRGLLTVGWTLYKSMFNQLLRGACWLFNRYQKVIDKILKQL